MKTVELLSPAKNAEVGMEAGSPFDKGHDTVRTEWVQVVSPSQCYRKNPCVLSDAFISGQDEGRTVVPEFDTGLCKYVSI